MISKRVQQEIFEDRLTTIINVELGLMVTEGLLEMSVTPEGEAYFFPTARGCLELGMEFDDSSETIARA